MDAKDAKGLAGEVAKIRTQWLAIVRNLGVENLAPAEERTRVDRLEKALGQVFLFAAQLRFAEALGVRKEWSEIIGGTDDSD